MKRQGVTTLLVVCVLMSLPACGGGEPDAKPVAALSEEEARALEVERLVQVGGDDVGRLYQAGLSLTRAGHPAAAAEKLEAARDLAPENSVIQRSLWYVYRMLGRADDALVALQAAVQLDPNNLDAGLELVRDYSRRRRIADAHAILDGLRAVHPDDAAVHAAAGALARRDGDDEAARAAFDRALAIDPREAEALFGLGLMEQQAGNLAAAGEQFAAAVAAAPDHLGALMGLGSYNSSSGDNAKAAEYFLQALKLDPRYFLARRSLGNVLLLDGLFDEAVQLFEQGVTLTPQDLNAHFYLGKAYLQRGRIDEAEQEFEFVARTDFKRVDAFLELARLYSLRGEIDRSSAAVRQILALGFDDFDLLRNDPDFENLMAATTVRTMLDEAERAAAGGGS